MPFKSDNIPINNEKLDRRIKLTTQDKENIINEYKMGDISITSLAKKYNVSKRTIQFTLFPERRERARQLYAERRKNGNYYDKDKHAESVRRHRQYKKKLLDKGLIGQDLADLISQVTGGEINQQVNEDE